jgi:hypothetical protein
MLRTILATLLLLAPAAVASAATCPGTDPQITSVAVVTSVRSGALVHYHLSGKVVNLGAASQASNVLQSVDIFDADDKLDTKSIPPLAAGQSFTFTYVFTRSGDAGAGTTTLGFQLDPISGCSTGSDRFPLTF